MKLIIKADSLYGNFSCWINQSKFQLTQCSKLNLNSDWLIRATLRLFSLTEGLPKCEYVKCVSEGGGAKSYRSALVNLNVKCCGDIILRVSMHLLGTIKVLDTIKVV